MTVLRAHILSTTPASFAGLAVINAQITLSAQFVSLTIFTTIRHAWQFVQLKLLLKMEDASTAIPLAQNASRLIHALLAVLA